MIKNSFYTSKFKKDFDRIKTQGKDVIKLKILLNKIQSGIPLDVQNKDHALKGNWTGYRECHIEPDWLLIYKTTDDTVSFVRTGSHSELF